MILILIAALSLSTPLSTDVLKNTANLSSFFHKKCLKLISDSNKHKESLQALLCGEQIHSPQLKGPLSQTSLIHIFVVSGSHLLLIDQIFHFLKIPFFVRFFFLSLYSMAVGWQAPAVRALFGLCLRYLCRKKSLFFSTDLTVLLTGCLTLFLFPDWWRSKSLLMSWCAALALSAVSIYSFKRNWARLFASQLSIYFFMLAPLWGFGSLHPLSLLYNFFLGPLIALVLFPLGLLSVCLPYFALFF